MSPRTCCGVSNGGREIPQCALLMRDDNTPFPKHACLLAAGYGKRLRPITLETPKPLVKVGRVAMLERMAEFVQSAGVSSLHVNASYLGEQIASWCETYGAVNPEVSIETSMENAPLETGGGIAKMLREHAFDDAPFFSCNADIICVPSSESRHPLARMANAMDDETDIVMLLSKKQNSLGYEGAGDFVALEERDGVIHSFRRYDAAKDEGKEAYIFMGIQLLRPDLFSSKLPEAFSMNHIYNQRVSKGGGFSGMKAVVHDGMFLHVGDAYGLKKAEAYLAMGNGQ